MQENNNKKTATVTNGDDLDLESIELPLGELSLDALPSEYSYLSLACAGSLTSFSSAGSCFSSLGSAASVSE